MQIDLQRPTRMERVRGFQPPWHTVYVYTCANGHEVRVRKQGTGMPPGAIMCPQCER